MTKDVKIGETVLFMGHQAKVVDLHTYDNVDYAKLDYRGILVPFAAMWRGVIMLEVE